MSVMCLLLILLCYIIIKQLSCIFECELQIQNLKIDIYFVPLLIIIITVELCIYNFSV